MANENAVVSKGTTKSFIDYNLVQLGVDTLPEDDHTRKLVKNGLLSVVDYATKNNEKLNEYSPSSVIRTVETIKELGLNMALPNMAYIVVYNVGGVKDVRVAPFKNGYREIFQNYGDDVKKIHAIWQVREGDVFVAPKWKGIKMTDAEYEQKSSFGKVIKTVLVYETLDSEIKYLIAERNNVIPSLIGIVRKYGGQTKETDSIIDKIKELNDLDKAYEYVLKTNNRLLSPAYKDHYETMVETKMLNFIVRNHPISDRKATPSIKKALESVLDMDFEDTTHLDTKVNDKNLKDDISNGEVSSQKVVEDEPQQQEKPEEVNVSKDFVEKDEEPIKEEETKPIVEDKPSQKNEAPNEPIAVDEEPQEEDLFSQFLSESN